MSVSLADNQDSGWVMQTSVVGISMGVPRFPEILPHMPRIRRKPTFSSTQARVDSVAMPPLSRQMLLSPSEGVYGESGKGRPELDSIGGVDAMNGRYPFYAVAGMYLEKRKGALVESTMVEMDRIFRYFDKVLRGLKEEGHITTTNPDKLSREDVQAFIGWMRERGLDPSVQVKYIGFIEALTSFRNNGVIEELRTEGGLPRPIPKDIRTLDAEALVKVQKAASGLGGWHGAIGEFLTIFFQLRV